MLERSFASDRKVRTTLQEGALECWCTCRTVQATWVACLRYLAGGQETWFRPVSTSSLYPEQRQDLERDLQMQPTLRKA